MSPWLIWRWSQPTIFYQEDQFVHVPDERIGLAFVFHGVIEEGSAGWFGLALLFVGIGYIVLWFFEDRQANVARVPDR